MFFRYVPWLGPVITSIIGAQVRGLAKQNHARLEGGGSALLPERSNMSYSLNSLMGVIQQITLGTILGLIKGDTRSLDSGSYRGLNDHQHYGPIFLIFMVYGTSNGI